MVVGIWRAHTKRAARKIAGGAYQLSTPAAVVAKTNVARLRKVNKLK